MKIKNFLVLTTSVALLATLSVPAVAKLPKSADYPAEKIKAGCGSKGDTYFAPSTAGVYGCMKANGSGVVCGGGSEPGPDKEPYADTCTVFRKVPPRLPSREEITKYQTRMQSR
jgi:hypothetical protein